ncbi:MAG: PfkB family carbohydrate kinase [Bacteroidetes bacterium]|nr:PfkB family carbohydrate kinase [Bacteroidota bacterium]
MRKVFAIGETLLDIIFQTEDKIVARPGGSMVNCAVSLGRSNIPVYLVSGFASDKTGELISRFLAEHHVSTEYVYRYDGRTALALAFLDKQKNAEYSFYHDDVVKESLCAMPVFHQNDILIFGSFYSLRAANRPQILKILESAKQKDMMILYDPNFRRPHLPHLKQVMASIIENISSADVVRGSDEDFMFIFGKTGVTEVYKIISGYGCKNLIYTSGSRGVTLVTEAMTKHYPVPLISAVSTVGAGDSFNAGIILMFYRYNVAKSNVGRLSEKQWDGIIGAGIDFGACVCGSDENYISTEFARAYSSSDK